MIYIARKYLKWTTDEFWRSTPRMFNEQMEALRYIESSESEEEEVYIDQIDL